MKVRRALLYVEAAVLLCLHAYRLSRQPFAKVIGRYKGKTPQGLRLVDTRSSDTVWIEAIAWAVQAAAKRMPFKAECLQTSLTVYHMLIRRRIPCQLVLGAQKVPFEAHAWVTCGGRVVTDSDDVVARYPVLMRI